MDAATIYSGLLERGFAPVQAAALTGNIQQESGFNPAALNKGEGANGLLQWRLDRWQALQDYAKSRGMSPGDVSLQLDFIGQEMRGAEAKNAEPFLSAPDLPSANAALKRFIRYGDNSEAARLANAAKILGAPQPVPQQAVPFPSDQVPYVFAPAAATAEPQQQPVSSFWDTMPAEQPQPLVQFKLPDRQKINVARAFAALQQPRPLSRGFF